MLEEGMVSELCLVQTLNNKVLVMVTCAILCIEHVSTTCAILCTFQHVHC